MNEQIEVRKKRDWLKNAMIVFLTIMLVLTFFSNTIMNYSLPEVSAQYVNSGTIQAKVRGSGTIEAGDPYTVLADSNRKIESVAVRNGDHVEKGDVLFYLQEGENAELKEAQKTLDQMLDRYKQSVLASGVDPEMTNQLLNGKFTKYDTYKTQIDLLKNEIQQIDDVIKTYEEEIAYWQSEKVGAQSQTSTEAYDKRIAYEATVVTRQNAENTLANAISVSGAADIADATAKLTQINQTIADVQKKISDIKSSTEYQQAQIEYSGYEMAVENAKSALETAVATYGSGSPEVETAQTAWNKAVTDFETHKQKTIYQELNENIALLEAEQTKSLPYEAVVKANEVLEMAKTEEVNALKAFEAAGPDHSVAISQYESVLSIRQNQKQEQEALKAEKESQLNKILGQMTQENTLSAELEAIYDQKELIAEMQKDTKSGNIIAPVSGTVQNLSLTAGTTTITGEQVAVIVPDGTVYTMEVSVTKEQAQRLSVGDVADIQNSWYYAEVKAILQQIRVDKADPANKRVLVFRVEGDVSGGQNLNISIGQKSAEYDCIVPNSAVREDNNGKFVLIVKQKSSPLGNRYYAERVDVEVLGSDDTQSAIAGDLRSYEYVITTATKPVEAGQLIRLAD